MKKLLGIVGCIIIFASFGLISTKFLGIMFTNTDEPINTSYDGSKQNIKEEKNVEVIHLKRWIDVSYPNKKEG